MGMVSPLVARRPVCCVIGKGSSRPVDPGHRFEHALLVRDIDCSMTRCSEQEQQAANADGEHQHHENCGVTQHLPYLETRDAKQWQ